MAEKRPVRVCDVCGGVDDHPRHVIAYAPGGGTSTNEIAMKAMENAHEKDKEAVMAQIRDDTVIMRHMDCCRTVGCPDGSCYEVTKGAEEKRGDALVRHLTKGGK